MKLPEETAEQDRLIMTLARAWRPGDQRVADAWPLVVQGLEHQGRPAGNLSRIAAMLDRTNCLGGWDEFGVDEATGQPGMVEVWFIREFATCDRAALLAEVTALRAATAQGMSRPGRGVSLEGRS
ncbi:hypothetical protein ACFQO7_32065 [Catellatospora aurea]|uniref:Uncharacterized protein n=1 Tax=Catellatospora aurea TaxID=1337874 RepID=A0ABW2H767_9ACTN